MLFYLIVRRTKYAFREQIKVEDSLSKYEWGLSQLDLIKRHAIISSLYPEEKSVLSNK